MYTDRQRGRPRAWRRAVIACVGLGCAGGAEEVRDIEWVQIPAGSVSMTGDDGGDEPPPVHTVTLRAFELSKTEVTTGQYRKCVEAGACTAPDVAALDVGGAFCNWGQKGREDHPVNCVDWGQAVAFATWAGGRLPTESEWEYAARAGEAYEYAGSANPDEVAWYSENSGMPWWFFGGRHDGTQPVARKRANAWGLHDMSGNVAEWVQDSHIWAAGYEGAPTDGSAREVRGGGDRVVRGGSWNSATSPPWDGGVHGVRITTRDAHDPEWGSYEFGIRVAR